MTDKQLIILWAITPVISIWFFRFGLSDILNPCNIFEYIDHNPMRPLFRVAFGTIMSLFTIGTALVLTYRRR